MRDFERWPAPYDSENCLARDSGRGFSVPRIPPKILNSVFYLYASAEDANAGKNFGGSGFFVGIMSEVSGYYYNYAVTNWHVACRDGFSVIRVNNLDGTVDTYSAGPEEWEFDPRFDIAVIKCNLDRKVNIFSSIVLPNSGVMREDITTHKLGPGEDVFLVGRFIDHDGGITNNPAVRFGNISVMPSKIQQPNHAMADSYCIDVHSRTGFSGSPVFVYRTPGYDLEDKSTPTFGDDTLILTGGAYLSLLGIHFAQFPETWEIKEGLLPRAESGDALIREGAYVKGMSGMCCALPAWSILEVLNMPKLKAARKKNDETLRAKQVASGYVSPDAESTSPPANDENPNHRGDFMRLVDAAARKPEPKG